MATSKERARAEDDPTMPMDGVSGSTGCASRRDSTTLSPPERALNAGNMAKNWREEMCGNP
jgi:hypothetical protein